MTVTLNPAPSSDPVLALEPGNGVMVLWDKSAFVSGGAFIYFTYRTIEGWAATQPISQSLGISRLIAPPMVGTDGKTHLVWKADSSGPPYRLIYSAWDGNQWSPEIEFMNEKASSTLIGQVRLNQQSEPILLSYYPSIWNTSISETIVHTGWTQGFSIPDPGSTQQIWLDGDGGVRLYGVDWTSNIGLYSYWKADSFLVTKRSFGIAAGTRDAILDGEDNLHLIRLASVAIPGKTVTGLYHECLAEYPAWFDLEKPISGQEPITAYHMTRGPNGNIAIGWFNQVAQSVTVTLWQGCVQQGSTTIALPQVPYHQWLYFDALAYQEQPDRVCILMAQDFGSSDPSLFCANKY